MIVRIQSSTISDALRSGSAAAMPASVSTKLCHVSLAHDMADSCFSDKINRVFQDEYSVSGKTYFQKVNLTAGLAKASESPYLYR